METRPKTFAYFAARRFNKNHTDGYETKPLIEPLLNFTSHLDQEAARSVSLAIYRYTKDDIEPSGSYSTKSIYRELISGLKQGSKNGKFSPYSLIHGRKMSELDKVHLICGIGILGPQLRDEIFCQICKNIIGNPSRKSRQKGWTLLACCLCLYLPSDEFIPYFDNFVKSGPEVEQRYCTEKFNRTRLNGNRSEPLSSMEHQSIVNRGSFAHVVSLANGQVCKVSLDSATTGLELRKKLKSAKGMVDLFGFSFRVKVGNQISKVIYGSDHVMDIISSCEQLAKELNVQELCSLCFFKEIFSPWHSPFVDPKATELIYNQIISSIRTRKYKIKEDLILAKIVAMHCYVLHGINTSKRHMEEMITYLIHSDLITKSTTKGHWLQMVNSSFDKKYRRVQKDIGPTKAVGELVNYAKHMMTDDFSRFFELAGNTSGLSVNCKNVCVYSSKPSVPSWKLMFPEIKKVTYEKFKGRRTGTVTITTIHNEERKLMAQKAEDIHQLLNFFLTGLRKRSKYLLAFRDHQPPDNSFGQLGFVNGDLIILKGKCNGETLYATGRGYGSCQRTGSSGEFSGGQFYIIPVLETPSTTLLQTLKNSAISKTRETKVTDSLEAKSELVRTRSYVDWLRNVSSSELSKQSSELVLEREKHLSAPLSDPPLANIQDVYQPSSRQQEKPEKTQITNPLDVIDAMEPESFSSLPPAQPESNIYAVNQSFFYQQDFHVNESLNTKTEIFLGSKKSSSGSSLSLSERSTGSHDIHPLSSNKTTLVVENSKTTSSDVFLSSDTTGTTDIAPEMTQTSNEAVYQIPSTEVTPNIQSSEDKTSIESVNGTSTDLSLPTKEMESLKLSENAGYSSVQKSTISSFAKKDGIPRRHSTISFKDSPSYKAIISYIYQPAGDIMTEMNLTEIIFGKPLFNTTSEDNVYLEIVKHIREEESVTNVERSWELMWMITGLYPCSDNIKDDVISLLREATDSNPLAKQCYMRLVKMITHGRRTYPPHIAEVQAIQTRMDLINHKVFFPDGSCQSFEVESATTARHLVSVITESIGLKYSNGCGLFFKIGEKVFGAADEYFFFDFIQHFIEVWRRSEKGGGIVANYKVFFLRKVWINVVPGADRVADCRLHYYQELSKYLRGYHKCTKEESILLAALIFRAEFGGDTEHFSEIPDMLNKLVPQDVISEMSVDEWEKALGQALSGNADCVGDDAKIQFLAELSKRSTFGSAYFHAKAKEPSYLPETLLIAIQTDGFALMNDTDKSVIEKHGFSEIERWSSGGQSISVEIKTSDGTKKLEFDTSLDYQIDDFLTSYIAAYGSENHEESTTSDEE